MLEEEVNGIARRVAEYLTLCAVGYRALARWCGMEVEFPRVLDAMRANLADVQGNLVADGVTAADRLYDAVFEHEASRSWAFPRKGQSAPENRDREGAMDADHLYIFPAALKQVAKEIGLDDPDAALRGLRDQDRLLPGEGRNLARKMWLERQAVRVYVFVRQRVGSEVVSESQSEAESEAL